MHTYKHTNIQTYIHTNIHPPTGGRAHTYHTYVHACMLAHLHTDTHPPTDRGAGATELVTYNPPHPQGGGRGKKLSYETSEPIPFGGGLAGLDHIYHPYIVIQYITIYITYNVWVV